MCVYKSALVCALVKLFFAELKGIGERLRQRTCGFSHGEPHSFSRMNFFLCRQGLNSISLWTILKVNLEQTTASLNLLIGSFPFPTKQRIYIE